jgi:outer membrane receptor protein involved in Fe transport
MMRPIRWALFATIVLGRGQTWADDDKKSIDTEQLGKMSLNDLLNVDVSVASRVESSAADAPSSVTVFTQEEIRRMGVITLQELLNFVPGFQSMREVEQGRYDTIGARGRSNALSDSVLVLVDGQRVNDLYTGGAALLNRMMAVENIRQVEIIRGPGSALYGANAFLGVIDVKTISGVDALWLGAGNAGTRVAAVAVTRKFDDITVDAFVRVSEQAGFPYHNVVDDHGLMGDQQDRTQTLDATGAISYEGATLRVRHMARHEGGFLTFANLSDPNVFEDTQQSSIVASYVKKLSNLDVSGSVGYTEDEWRSISELAPAGFEIAPGFFLPAEFRGGPLLRTHYYSANVDVTMKPTPELTVAGGAAFEYSKYSAVGDFYNYNPLTLDYFGQVQLVTDAPFSKRLPRDVFGAYAQVTYKAMENLSATAGVRVDEYNDFGSSLNPRAAIVYKTPVDSRVKLMYGRAFRAPNFLELHDQFNPVDYGNENLTAETVDTIELAYVQDVGKVFRGTATYFENILQNEITFGTPGTVSETNPYGAPTYANSGSSTHTRGLELELRAQIVSGLDVYGTYTHLAGDGFPSTTDPTKPPTTFPHNFGALAVNYAYGPFQVNVNGIARGHIQAVTQDPYVIANARVEYEVAPHTAVYINGRNLLDTSYYTPASLIPMVGVPNQGRLVLVGLIMSQ